MRQLFTDIYNIFLQIINNENYINVISIIVVALTSYHIAQYNASKPEKLKIKQLQFTNLYLPLFRILTSLPTDPTLQQATEIRQKVSDILDKNYELAFPQLHELNNRLDLAIIVKHDYQKILSIMKHQVEVDYELLKKRLGYPSANFYSIFLRMTFKQKVEFFVGWFNFLSFIGIIIVFIVAISYYIEHSALIFFTMIVAIIVDLFLMINLSKWVKKMKD